VARGRDSGQESIRCDVLGPGYRLGVTVTAKSVSDDGNVKMDFAVDNTPQPG